VTVIGAVRPLEELQPGDKVVVQAEAGRTVELTVQEAGWGVPLSYVILVAPEGTGVLSARYVEDPA